MNPWYREQEQGWQAALEVLRSAGWTANLVYVALPVMVEGSLPDGELFALYAKDDVVEFGVGGPDPGDMPEWTAVENHEDASRLGPVDGMAILQRLYDRYLTEQPDLGKR